MFQNFGRNREQIPRSINESPSRNNIGGGSGFMILERTDAQGNRIRQIMPASNMEGGMGLRR